MLTVVVPFPEVTGFPLLFRSATYIYSHDANRQDGYDGKKIRFSLSLLINTGSVAKIYIRKTVFWNII